MVKTKNVNLIGPSLFLDIRAFSTETPYYPFGRGFFPLTLEPGSFFFFE